MLSFGLICFEFRGQNSHRTYSGQARYLVDFLVEYHKTNRNPTKYRSRVPVPAIPQFWARETSSVAMRTKRDTVTRDYPGIIPLPTVFSSFVFGLSDRNQSRERVLTPRDKVRYLVGFMSRNS